MSFRLLFLLIEILLNLLRFRENQLNRKDFFLPELNHQTLLKLIKFLEKIILL